MSDISAEAVRELRNQTGAGVMDAKKALAEAKGDGAKAIELLKERGLSKAAKKGDREAAEGIIRTYVHGTGRVGVMLELNCETDFVARNDEFTTLATDICMQIAAQDPKVVTAEEVEGEADPKEAALLEQSFIKDPAQTVGDVITATISKLGENIKVSRFVRYELNG